MANVFRGKIATGGVPSGVVLKSTLTDLEPALAMARSGLPSPLKSPIETEMGPVPVANVVWLAYDGVVAPGAVVLKSTLTELEDRLAMARSGLPSPLKSPIEMEKGLLPVANVVWLAYDGAVAPGAVVLSSTLTELE